MGAWTDYLIQNKAQFLDELLEYLRIPSVSALPQYVGDVQRAGEWVANRLSAAGVESVRILPTGGHPVVYGEWLHAPGKPTILIYGHFDTQPVDPLDQWQSPPFNPTIRGGRIYARGASDDKGNGIIPILCVEAMLRTQAALPVNVKFFFEGQEEILSPQIPDFVAAHRELLTCDLVVSADGLQWADDQPAIYVGFKGCCALQIDVRTAKTDLHSGIFGATVQNPIHILADLIASMHGPDGKITVQGFYDSVRPFLHADRAAIGAIPFDEAAYKAQLGVDEVFGEPGYTTRERAWARPTLEVNGIWAVFRPRASRQCFPTRPMLRSLAVSCPIKSRNKSTS